jgi:hypothetical protein
MCLAISVKIALKVFGTIREHDAFDGYFFGRNRFRAVKDAAGCIAFKI